MKPPAAGRDEPVFVLVHGAWAGGWCYGRVAAMLRERGYRTFTPTLTGLGARSHIAGSFPITCSTHIRDIVNLLIWEDLQHVILCGHSYGGVVITGVADELCGRIGALIYADAIIPESGKTVLGINRSVDVVAGLLDATARAGGTLAPALPATLLGTNPQDVDYVDRMCTPHPLASFCEPIVLTGAWLGVRNKTYIRATGWQGFEGLGFHSYERVANDAGWTTVDVPCGHEIMLDAPEAMTDILISVARGGGIRE
jgi:pimeloyl-ACP methyl ester carboxylesterase